MDFLESNDFTGGMNSDAENRTIPKGDYRDGALNIVNGVGEGTTEGTVSNRKGNLPGPTPICPYNGGTQDTGQSITIGTLEDTITNSTIYMNWNVNGKHSIFRYYPNLNGQEVTQQVIQYNFGWQQEERITSLELIPSTTGQLLYWCDSQGLHNINLDRANVVNKNKSWKIFFVPASLAQVDFALSLYEFDNTTSLLSINISMAGHQGSLADYMNYIVSVINGVPSHPVTATTCDSYIEITETGINGWILTIPSSSGAIGVIVSDNWYGNILGDILFARAVAPSLFPPKLTYQQDSSIAFNNVKNHVFQGALQFYFKDFQESVLGVASQIPIDNLQSDGTNNPLYNYIDINFNNPDFIANLSLWLTVISQVAIIVREHNTGNWKTVEILYPSDFLDYANGAFFCHYKFYNNVQATDLDATASGNLDSGVPILADSEATIFNRIINGGITQGRDTTDCVEADYKIEISPTASPTLYSVMVYFRVLTYGMGNGENNIPNDPTPQVGFYDLFPNYDLYPFWKDTDPNVNYAQQRGGIFQNPLNVAPTPPYPFFGGGSFGMPSNNGAFGIRSGMETTYNQLLPEGGFTVYSAGKPFFATSKQINANLSQVNNTGVLDTSTSGNILDIGNYLGHIGQPTHDLYSVAILKLPKGKHVLRVASHWCSGGDLLNYGTGYNLADGLAYQKTSTNVHGVYISPNVQPMYDLSNSFQQAKEITIEVQSDMVAGTFLIMDVAPPWDVKVGGQLGISWNGINGYLFDSSANGILQTDLNSIAFDGETVEKAVVTLNANPRLRPGSTTTNLQWQGFITDHNGYLFGICALTNTAQLDSLGLVTNAGFEFTLLAWQISSGVNPTQIISNSGQNVYGGLIYTGKTGNLSQYYSRTLQPLNFFNNNAGWRAWGVGTLFFCTSTNNAASRQSCSTIITGDIIDQNGNAIVNALAVYQEGKFSNTSQTGQYNIVAWGDLITPNSPNFNLFSGVRNLQFTIANGNERFIDNLIISLGTFSNGTYPSGQIVSISIVSFGGLPYSPTHPYQVSVFTIIETLIVTQKAQKRGGKKLYGLRYYDIAGRVCSVELAFAAYIPFETEDLSLFPNVINPVTNLPYNALTVLGGQPTLTWILSPNFAPPQYAAYYQWMWTDDGVYANYLQWVANNVQYVSAFANPIGGSPAINTSFQNNDYVGVLISISNIASYLQTNPDSIITYSYTAGDRLRLISDRNNVLINTVPTYQYTQGIYDFEITGTDSNGNLIVKLPLLPFEIQSGFTIEIYSPATLEGSDIQVFYEVGEVYKCTNPGQPNNAHSVLTAAFTSGDTYWRGRLILVADTITDFTGAYPIVIEANTISDFYPSLDSDINPSRTGTINTNLKQIYYSDRLIVSDAFQAGSAYNGLSFCLPTNISDLGRTLGNVARLIVIGKLLHAIMRSNNVSNNVGVVSMRISQSTGTLEALSDDFLNTASSYQSRQNFGTDLPAAVIPIDGTIYAPFALRNAIGRHDDNGFIEISRNEIATYTPGTPNSETHTRMVNYFRNLMNNGKIWDAVAVFDKRYKDYIITIWPNANYTGAFLGANPPTTGYPISYSFNLTQGSTLGATLPVGTISKITYTDSVTGLVMTVTATVNYVSGATVWFLFPPGTYNINPLFGPKPATILTFVTRGQGTTVSWSETKHRWPTTWSYVPECYGVLGDNVYAFLNGQLWKQDTNPLYNNWFGVQFDSSATVVLNDKPDYVKTWNAMSLMQLQADGNNNWDAPLIENDRGQKSRLLQGAWRKLEEFWYTAFKRDLTDQSVTNPILNGRPLKSSSLVITLRNTGTALFKLYKIGYNASWSERTTK